MASTTSLIETPTARPAPPFSRMTSAPDFRVYSNTSFTDSAVTPGYEPSGTPPIVAEERMGTIESPCSPKINAFTSVALTRK